MNDWRKQHIAVARKPFQWQCERSCFAPRDQQFLSKWGSWLQALWSGKLRPATPDQERFVEAVNGRIACRTHAENLWQRYLIISGKGPFGQTSRSFEQHRGRTHPVQPGGLDPTVNWYGMDDESYEAEPDSPDVESNEYAMDNGVWPDLEVKGEPSTEDLDPGDEE